MPDILKHSLPSIVTFLLMALASASPAFMGGYVPMLLLLSVAIFTLYLPQAMPLWWAVCLALLQDVWQGAPLGVHGMAALILAMTMVRFGKALARQPMLFIWASLAVALACVQILLLLLLRMLHIDTSLMSALMNWAVTLPLIPPMQFFVARLATAVAIR